LCLIFLESFNVPCFAKPLAFLARALIALLFIPAGIAKIV
jgi:hypothetical protein